MDRAATIEQIKEALAKSGNPDNVTVEQIEAKLDSALEQYRAFQEWEGYVPPFGESVEFDRYANVVFGVLELEGLLPVDEQENPQPDSEYVTRIRNHVARILATRNGRYEAITFAPKE